MLTADNNTTLSNYTTVETIPVLKSIVDEGKLNKWESQKIYSTKAEALAAAGKTDDSTEDSTEDPSNSTEDAKKAVQNTKTTLKSVTTKRSGKKNTKVTVKFTKVKGMKYQIQYSYKKDFSSKKTSVWVGTVGKAGTHKRSFTIKGNNNKKVWVRVRAYKKINGKNVYGKWSAKKKITTVKKK